MIDPELLSVFSQKIHTGTATKAEKDDYMWMLYQNGSITKAQYDNYLSGANANDILNTALAIGAIILLGLILKKAIE